MRLEPRPLYHMVMTPLAKVLLSFDQALFLALRSHLCLTTFTVMLICRYLSNYLFISSKKKKEGPMCHSDFSPNPFFFPLSRRSQTNAYISSFLLSFSFFFFCGCFLTCCVWLLKHVHMPACLRVHICAWCCWSCCRNIL